jgi:LemA protein
MAIVLVVLAAVAVLALYGVGLFNRLVKQRNEVREAWAGIDVQLTRRADLIPNLVETVKGYAAHERETLQAVIEARNRLTAASTPGEAATADAQLQQATKSLFALAEKYPDLKASTNFLDLQRQLAATEEDISLARRYYNAMVETYNTGQQKFPAVLLAGPFGHRPAEYFEAEESARTAPRVEF